MTRIFISHTKENAVCVEHLLQGLEAKGFTVWREPPALTLQSPSYAHTIENGILGSAAVVLVWSSSAAQSQWVTWHLLVAHSLKKPLFFVVLDSTLLPDTLEAVTSIQSQASCTEVVAQLVPQLPPPDGTDVLIALSEQAAHEFIRIRRMAIHSADEMLRRGDHREEVLVLLGYLAHNDEAMNVRNDAQAVIKANTKKGQTWSDDTRHIFGVRCKNGHMSYFDKRVVCTAARSVIRGTKESPQDELHLICKTCKEEVVDYQDCRDYK